MSISVSLAPVNTEVSVSSSNDVTVSLTNPTTTVEVNNQALSLPQSLGTGDSPTFTSVKLEDASSNTTTIQEGASGNITLTLPASTGTVALTSDIGFVAPTTVVGSAAISDMTSNISKKYVHTGSAVTLKFPNVTASSNLGDTWVVVNAGTDTLTFDRVTSGTSQFKQLNGSTVASLANTITLSKGGVAELTVTADNEIIIFGSGVI